MSLIRLLLVCRVAEKTIILLSFWWERVFSRGLKSLRLSFSQLLASVFLSFFYWLVHTWWDVVTVIFSISGHPGSPCALLLRSLLKRVGFLLHTDSWTSYLSFPYDIQFLMSWNKAQIDASNNVFSSELSYFLSKFDFSTPNVKWAIFVQTV